MGGSLVGRFAERFEAAGGEVVLLGSEAEASAWLEGLEGFSSVACGAMVPPGLSPDLPAGAPDEAALGVSMARCAAADTGTLVLESREGRLLQLLPPTHLIWVRPETIHPTLSEALSGLRNELPSALGLHSGPSKSADIGRVMVTGVHGPGRVIAAVVRL